MYVNKERGERARYHCQAGAGPSSAGTWVQDVASDAGISQRVGTLPTPTAIPGNRKVPTAWRQDTRRKRLATKLIFDILWVSLSSHSFLRVLACVQQVWGANGRVLAHLPLLCLSGWNAMNAWTLRARRPLGLLLHLPL